MFLNLVLFLKSPVQGDSLTLCPKTDPFPGPHSSTALIHPKPTTFSFPTSTPVSCSLYGNMFKSCCLKVKQNLLLTLIKALTCPQFTTYFFHLHNTVSWTINLVFHTVHVITCLPLILKHWECLSRRSLPLSRRLHFPLRFLTSLSVPPQLPQPQLLHLSLN